jgi:hypothetical protein
MKRRCLAVFFGVCAIHELRAQTVDSVPLTRVPQGSEIRVWSQQPPLKKWKLIYTGYTGDAIQVTERRGSAPIIDFKPTIALRDLERVEVNRGRQYDGRRQVSHTLIGAALGALIGGTVGLLLDGGFGKPLDDPGMGLYIFGSLGTGIGGLAGAISGARGREVWAPVSIRR